MEKDFLEWHKYKSEIQGKRIRPFFHEREIWFCSLGLNVGFEQDGRGEDFLRPVIVLKKFNNEIFLGVPLTKSGRSGKYYFLFDFRKEVKSSAIISQIRLIDAKRLRYKIGDIGKSEFKELKQKIRQLLA